ncbi:hypothetical protein H2248_002289 [Termitomyces sp. 'cryptogamus']|nr:hypothetical protein H2248_002289 [Termitomyces sp. 'cryptogamus']
MLTTPNQNNLNNNPIRRETISNPTHSFSQCNPKLRTFLLLFHTFTPAIPPSASKALVLRILTHLHHNQPMQPSSGLFGGGSSNLPLIICVEPWFLPRSFSFHPRQLSTTSIDLSHAHPLSPLRSSVMLIKNTAPTRAQFKRLEHNPTRSF